MHSGRQEKVRALCTQGNDFIDVRGPIGSQVDRVFAMAAWQYLEVNKTQIVVRLRDSRNSPHRQRCVTTLRMDCCLPEAETAADVSLVNQLSTTLAQA